MSYNRRSRFSGVVAAGAELEDDLDSLYYGPDEDPEERGEIAVKRVKAREVEESTLEEELMFGRPRPGPSRNLRGCLSNPSHSWGLVDDEDSSEDSDPTRIVASDLRQRRFERETAEIMPDTRTDQVLVEFLKALDAESAYDLLFDNGYSMQNLLETTEQDLIKIGFVGPGMEEIRGRLYRGIGSARNYEWISHNSVAFLNSLLEASRIFPGQERYDFVIEERDRAIQRAKHELGSVCQQINNGSRLMEMLASAAGYLKKLCLDEPEKLQIAVASYEEDLEEVRINSAAVIKAAGRLKETLGFMRTILVERTSKELLAVNSP